MYIAIVSWPGCDVTNFEITFLIKLFLYMTENSRPKLKYLENKKLLSWNKKLFASFSQGFQLPKIASDVRVRLQIMMGNYLPHARII